MHSTMTILAVALAVLAAAPAQAKVFLARSEAIKAALPAAERVEARDVFLDEAQQAAIQTASGMPVDSALVTIYTGWSGGRVVGYALFDTHTVRTQPETFVVSLDPGGRVTGLFVCAFYEPQDYLPGERWLGQFKGRDPSHPPRVGADITGITGATLSSRAVAGGVRRALAIYATCLGGKTSRQVGE